MDNLDGVRTTKHRPNNPPLLPNRIDIEYILLLIQELIIFRLEVDWTSSASSRISSERIQNNDSDINKLASHLWLTIVRRAMKEDNYSSRFLTDLTKSNPELDTTEVVDEDSLVLNLGRYMFVILEKRMRERIKAVRNQSYSHDSNEISVEETESAEEFAGEITTEEAAELLGVSRPFVAKLFDEGKLPGRKVGRIRKMRKQDVVSFKKEVMIQRKDASRSSREAAIEVSRLSELLEAKSKKIDSVFVVEGGDSEKSDPSVT